MPWFHMAMHSLFHQYKLQGLVPSLWHLRSGGNITRTTIYAIKVADHCRIFYVPYHEL